MRKNKFLGLLALVLTVTAMPLHFMPRAHAAIIGQPFIPEVDSRFDNIEGNAVVNASTGLHQKQIAVATYDYSVFGGSSTVGGGVYNTGVALPAKALITRSYLWVATQLVGTGSTIAFSCQNANNIFTATDITGTTAAHALEGASTGASTVFKNITAACNVNATLAGTANLTAGKVTAYIEYVITP